MRARSEHFLRRLKFWAAVVQESLPIGSQAPTDFFLA
jgi:hypothetical protein